MLVAQAAYAAEKFLGRPVPASTIEETLAAITQSCANIVLIGMPGSGKSTVGAELAALTGRELVDTDTRIVEREGKSIPEIFSEGGESAFRAIESEVIAEVGRERGLIIACGGGAVLREENRRALRQNGWICRLCRPLDQLDTAGRPLSGDMEKMKAMEAVRGPIYAAMADLTADNISVPGDPAREILTAFLQYMD